MPRFRLFSHVWRSVIGCYTSQSLPLSHPAQQLGCYKSLVLGSAAFFSYNARLKTALGGSDLDSHYRLFPKICLALITIAYCRIFPQPLSVRHSFQSQRFLFWAIQKRTDIHICSKSNSSDNYSSSHHAWKQRTAPISRIGLVSDTEVQNTTSGH